MIVENLPQLRIFENQSQLSECVFETGPLVLFGLFFEILSLFKGPCFLLLQNLKFMFELLIFCPDDKLVFFQILTEKPEFGFES